MPRTDPLGVATQGKPANCGEVAPKSLDESDEEEDEGGGEEASKELRRADLLLDYRLMSRADV